MMQPLTIAVRDVRPRDLDAIVELDALAYDASFPERAPASREWKRYRRLALREELRRDPIGKWVAECEGRIIGFIFARFVGNTMDDVPYVHIESVAVDPAYRHRGVASRLLEQVEETARRTGIEWSELEVSVSNDEAVQLYERRGYTTYRIVMRKRVV
jgi:ribosomal protein S18 acetylase RimI-like enzyme